MSGLTRYKKSSYFNQYAILQYVNINNKYVTSQIIYPKSNNRMRFKSHNDFVTHLFAIKNAVEDYINNMDDSGKYVPRFVIYLDKESYNSHPVFKNEMYSQYIDFRIYNNIVPGYTTCISDISIKTLDKQLEYALHEIIYYVDRIGLGNFIDKLSRKKDDGTYSTQTVSFAYVARRFLEKSKEFSSILYNTTWFNINGSRFPKYSFIREVIPDIKKFNANKLVCHGADVRWENVCKYDINSSFWAIPLTEYTGRRPKEVVLDEYGFTTRGDRIVDLMTSNNVYMAKIRINKLLLTNNNKVDWLSLFNIDLNTKSIWLTNVEVKDILNTYNVDLDDFIIEKFYLLEKQPFPKNLRKLYQTLHKRKAEAKQNKEEQLKQCLKIIGHCLHGYAIGNWFVDEDNEKAYLNIATMCKIDKRYANHILTPIDSVFMYSYARSHLLKVLDLFSDNYYYDTDSVVAKRNDEALEEYNKWIDSKYYTMELNPNDYTHNGHTIGYLELEEVCDNFCHLSPKFYLWTNNGRLHSTTAGYQKNSVAEKIEEVSHLKGTDALKWFCEQDEIVLDLGYVSDGEKYVKNLFTYKKEKGLS